MSVSQTNDKITTSQAAILVTNYILGVTILTLPRSSVEKAGTPDVWITVLVSGLIAMAAGIVIAKLCQRYPGKTFFQFSSAIVGKGAGWLIGLFVAVHFLLITGFEVRAMAEVTQVFLLERTPIWAIILSFLWIGVYLIVSGTNPIARLCEIIFPITVVVFFLIAFMGVGLFEWNHLLPVLGSGFKPVWKSMKTTALSYTGSEILLIFAAFMSQPKKVATAVVFGLVTPLVIYAITIVMVIGVLSVDGVVTTTWPTLALIRSFEFPGVFVERFESLLLVIWIMQMFTTCTIGHFCSAYGLAQLFQKNVQPFIYGLLPVIYLVAIIPATSNDVFRLGETVGNMAMYLYGLMPLVLLVISRWRGKKREATP